MIAETNRIPGESTDKSSNIRLQCHIPINHPPILWSSRFAGNAGLQDYLRRRIEPSQLWCCYLIAIGSFTFGYDLRKGWRELVGLQWACASCRTLYTKRWTRSPGRQFHKLLSLLFTPVKCKGKDFKERKRGGAGARWAHLRQKGRFGCAGLFSSNSSVCESKFRNQAWRIL